MLQEVFAYKTSVAEDVCSWGRAGSKVDERRGVSKEPKRFEL